ncbi:MAG TPA: efflux RND transporter periplasmic adaptor subunit [Candidatus Eisenbacteria bacterium]|uniref:Efflux RND transporter periplasmic adaptor subunit n=1 Tax=Eiseniibacteriota bacterium TaxID=2212470 RepID=A0A7V2AT97_UNCEI|nr:efflux RND transporter periplasmic adaptor subunit [Candidatus Eisenbacteria bacterium]
MSRRTKSRKRFIWLFALIAAAAVAAIVLIKGGNGSGNGRMETVKAERGHIVEKALAVGSIVPRNEVSVKAKISGVVKTIYKEPGERIERGEPLLEIKPDPTPLELAQAKREVEMNEIGLKNAEKAFERSKELLPKGWISDKEFEQAEREYEQAALALEMSKDRLALIEKGSVNIAGSKIEGVIKAPISGYVLEKNVNIGDPVVPLTSYQAGTVLMTIADMDSLVFKGTVDEIDVGTLTIGMPAAIKVGALPDAMVPGTLEKISLKAREENNTRMFPVEISIDDPSIALLRAGYSANADIIINEAESVLTIPERVVYFQNDSVYVKVPGPDGAGRIVMIETGLSDAITVEVKSGLEEGQEILEKPQKKL